jgi:Spx/MgsR family transcriptional regulator
MVKLYGVPSCKQIRDSKGLFENEGIDYEFINIRKTPMDAALLRETIKQMGMDTVVNRKGPTYRKLGLKEKNLSDEELFKILLQEQGMIKRPLIKKGPKFWQSPKGFNREEILAFIRNE